MSKSEEKKKIYNPYSNLEGYNCFGCSPTNHLGLNLEFYEQGNYVISEWEPKAHFGGYKNVLHGGIQATLMDEIAIWCIQIKLKTAGVTAGMNVRYKNPVFIDRGKLFIKAEILNSNRKIVNVKTELFDADKQLCCDAEVKYFIYPEKIAREKLYYPDFEEFFKRP